MNAKPFHRVVLTGAAGKLGSVLREPLRALATTLVLSDICDGVDPAHPLVAGEEFVSCDVADHAAVAQLLKGADLIVHFGGASQEQAFEPILQSNIIGQFNLYDNALSCGIKRVVLASTNHVTGGYRADETVSINEPMRPDSLYAISKGYGELLARFYHDRHGIESVCLRIGTCIARPKSPRCLAAWLSHADLIELVRCAALAPAVGFSVVYGVSDNTQSWWQGDDAERIGYRPRDSADSYRAELERMRPNEAAPVWQGGNIFMRDYRKPETLANLRTRSSSEEPTASDPAIGSDC